MAAMRSSNKKAGIFLRFFSFGIMVYRRNLDTSLVLKLTRAFFLALWALAIVGFIGSYLIWPDTFAPQRIANHLLEFQTSALFIFLALSILRGLTLLPSTPLVLAGTLLFPHQAW